MGLTKAIGNMYPDVYCWKVLAGYCPHGCIYCTTAEAKKRGPAVANKYSGAPRLVEKELVGFGEGKIIFVASTTDLFAEAIDGEIIERILAHCRLYPGNCYLFQSKNPHRFVEFSGHYPPDVILGTTIESDIDHGLSNAPAPMERYRDMLLAKAFFRDDPQFRELKFMLSLEPVAEFNVNKVARWVKTLAPDYVSIGADSKNKHLPEPSGAKIRRLIVAIDGSTEIRLKGNLQRIYDASVKAPKVPQITLLDF